MGFRLEVYDNSNTNRKGILPQDEVVSAFRIEELNGQDTLTFVMNRASAQFSTIAFRDIIRLVDLLANSHASFRVRSIKDERIGETLSATIECEHIKYDMIGEVYPRWKPFVKALPSVVIDDVLAFSAFSNATPTPPTLIDEVLNFGSVMEMLESIRINLNTDMTVNEDKTINFAARGSDNNVRVKYSKNMLSIQRKQDVHDFFNVLYPFGKGEPPITIGGLNNAGIQGAEHIVESISGATIGFHNRMVVSDDSLNELYLEVTRATAAGSIGTRRRILDSTADDTCVVPTVFASLTVGDYMKVVSNSSGDEVNFVKDAGSISTYATLGSTLNISSIAGTVNLLLTTALDGAYSSGLCENWDEIGTVTTAENTDLDFIRFGNRSQKVSGAADGEGISQDITLVDGQLYSAAVWIFIVSGEVHIEFFDGDVDIPGDGSANSTQTGVWVQILVEGVTAAATDGIIKILGSDLGGDSEYYVDAVVIEKLSRLSSPSEFYKISGARDLWNKGVDILRQRSSPKFTYAVGVADLYEGNRESYKYDQFSIGDTVTVEDSELGIDVDVRIVRKSWNIYDPWEARIEIDNLVDRLDQQQKDSREKFRREDRNRGIEGGRRSEDRLIAGGNTQSNFEKVIN